MNYKIGDKVETPLGVGVIDGLVMYDNSFGIFFYKVNSKIWFDKKYIQPYKSAHDKLLELGFEVVVGGDLIVLKHEKYDEIIEVLRPNKTFIFRKQNYEALPISLELGKILTQYLEELND